MITLTRKQNEAVKIMSTKFNSKDPITVIAGYAGVGKSSIINHFIEQNDLMENTAFATYTGKASLVLQNKGVPATTIHRLIYKAFRNRRTGKFFFRRKESLNSNIKLIVIDEVSMVPDKLLRDLMLFEIPIIALGDPGQLEPIGKDNGLLKKPDYFLEEIHRQAADSSIVRLSKLIREGKPLPLIDNDSEVKVISKEEVSLPLLQWPDQILCGRNATRRGINQEVRESLGYEGIFPNSGEKVICLRNYWDNLNDEEEPLINGTIGEVVSIKKPKIEDLESIIGTEEVYMDVGADYTNSQWSEVAIDPNIFKGFAPFSQKNPASERVFHEFDFGYAITTHKAQGSEFDKVLVFEERLGGGNHSRWLYTAVTRAIEKIVIVKA